MDFKKIFPKLSCMAARPKRIDIERQIKFMKATAQMVNSCCDGLEKLKESGRQDLEIEGWPTAIRGANYIRNMVLRIVGESGAPIDFESFLKEGESVEDDPRRIKRAKQTEADLAEGERKLAESRKRGKNQP